ncbi:hypothetical protein IFM89_010451 [Coptis chinensis]|uniref:Transmembrane protein n=1 Tax=Coptis chinensis TaxID=261450 RepID=A0A835I2V9_9MAGN|nr:hypothetical protein IFM89_010451 [Coptis chinensis]
MSTPLEPFQQPPPPPIGMVVAQQQAYNTNSSHGSYGPFIAVILVITILGILAVIVGRLCSGRRIFGYGPHYDFESWIETKCSSCIDGRIDLPTQQQTNTSEQVPVAIPVNPPDETKQQEQSHSAQDPSSATSS